jgi:signal transduction histidine kinase/Tfp pilus assembly protein PilF
MHNSPQILLVIALLLFIKSSLVFADHHLQDSSNIDKHNIQFQIKSLLIEVSSLPDSAIGQKKVLFDKAIKLTANNSFDELEAEIYFNLGLAQFKANKFRDALESFQVPKNYYNNKKDLENLRTVYEEEGYCFQRLGNLDKAEMMFMLDLSISQNINNDSTVALAKTNLGHTKWRKGKFQEALDYFSQALLIRRSLNLQSQIASSLNSIGSVYWKTDFYSKALQNFIESLRIRIDINDTLGQIISVNNIGLIYQKIGHIEKANNYFNEGLLQSQSSQYKFGEAYSLYNLGLSELQIDNPDKAIELFKNSLSISSEIGYLNLSLMTEIYLGECHENLGSYQIALNYFMDSKLKSENLDDSFVKAKAGNCVARVLLTLGKQSKEIESYLKESNHISISENLQELLVENYNIYYELYKRDKRNLKSLEFYKKRTEIKEQIINERMINSITDMLVGFEIKKTEIELELLKKERDLQQSELRNAKIIRNLIIGISAFGLILIIILLFFYRNKVRYSREISKQKELLESLNKQLIDNNNRLSNSNATKDKLFSLVAHDLRNPIGVLVNYASLLASEGSSLSREELQDIYKSLELSTETITLLIDDLLNWVQAQSDSLKVNLKETQISSLFENSLNIYQHLADLKNITLKYIIEKEVIVLADQHLIDSVIRNLLSNSLKFTPKNGKVYLKAEVIKNECIVSVSDNGTGISEKEIENILSGRKLDPKVGTSGEIGSGIGLNLTNEFLKLHDSELKINSDGKTGSQFSFTLSIV